MAQSGRLTAVLLAALAVAVLGVAAWRWRDVRFWWLFEPLGKNAQGYPEYRHRQTGIVMVRVPGGTFLMGSAESEAEREDDDGPVHEVELSPFLIGKHQVSQSEWERVMGSHPSGYRGMGNGVEAASWADCQEFCRKAGLGLPTEAQWEYACRAVAGTPESAFEWSYGDWCQDVAGRVDFPFRAAYPLP